MNLGKIRTFQRSSIEQRYEKRDTILYALGLGYGAYPLDEAELRFVYEEQLRALPSMCCILCNPGFWLQDPAYEVNWLQILHAELAFEIHAPIPPSGTLRGEFRVTGIEDKGAATGALLHQEKTIYDTVGGQRKLATVRSTWLLRANGGEGGFGATHAAARALPEDAPDRIVDLPTLERAALIYRLSGDWNPLHADPKSARKAGFERPILHGLCTAGMACRGVLAAYADNDPEPLRSMFVRFSGPVFPGETVRLELYEHDQFVRFRARAHPRGTIVLDRCSAEFGFPGVAQFDERMDPQVQSP